MNLYLGSIKDKDLATLKNLVEKSCDDNLMLEDAKNSLENFNSKNDASLVFAALDLSMFRDSLTVINFLIR